MLEEEWFMCSGGGRDHEFLAVQVEFEMLLLYPTVW
jgi:hypothetical protein